jgi:hypothetical protein
MGAAVYGLTHESRTLRSEYVTVVGKYRSRKNRLVVNAEFWKSLDVPKSPRLAPEEWIDWTDRVIRRI